MLMIVRVEVRVERKQKEKMLSKVQFRRSRARLERKGTKLLAHLSTARCGRLVGAVAAGCRKSVLPALPMLARDRLAGAALVCYGGNFLSTYYFIIGGK